MRLECYKFRILTQSVRYRLCKMALTLLYNGSSTDHAAIITACGASLSANIVVIPQMNGTGVMLFKDN